MHAAPQAALAQFPLQPQPQLLTPTSSSHSSFPQPRPAPLSSPLPPPPPLVPSRFSYPSAHSSTFQLSSSSALAPPTPFSHASLTSAWLLLLQLFPAAPPHLLPQRFATTPPFSSSGTARLSLSSTLQLSCAPGPPTELFRDSTLHLPKPPLPQGGSQESAGSSCSCSLLSSPTAPSHATDSKSRAPDPPQWFLSAPPLPHLLPRPRPQPLLSGLSTPPLPSPALLLQHLPAEPRPQPLPNGFSAPSCPEPRPASPAAASEAPPRPEPRLSPAPPRFSCCCFQSTAPSPIPGVYLGPIPSPTSPSSASKAPPPAPPHGFLSAPLRPQPRFSRGSFQSPAPSPSPEVSLRPAPPRAPPHPSPSSAAPLPEPRPSSPAPASKPCLQPLLVVSFSPTFVLSSAPSVPALVIRSPRAPSTTSHRSDRPQPASSGLPQPRPPPSNPRPTLNHAPAAFPTPTLPLPQLRLPRLSPAPQPLPNGFSQLLPAGLAALGLKLLPGGLVLPLLFLFLPRVPFPPSGSWSRLPVSSSPGLGLVGWRASRSGKLNSVSWRPVRAYVRDDVSAWLRDTWIPNDLAVYRRGEYVPPAYVRGVRTCVITCTRTFFAERITGAD